MSEQTLDVPVEETEIAVIETAESEAEPIIQSSAGRLRLKRIKIAGFKSFVDPTTVDFPKDLVAVVGPNGCGKSNVIDAVRWVMGESSAKTLRGGTMTDVIFNGSTARKPVGQASVELVFDNQSGRLGGAYASYAEISIRRVVGRDGGSDYYLNGSSCRRKDITDIFLGTGLGPRSYAIIEQGMISRFVEAKPEDVRVFLEEAAGISKYKERRKETESRLQETQENMARLQDLSDEWGKQLRHLERQAEKAKIYIELQGQEKTLSTQMQALIWVELNTKVVAQQAKIEVHTKNKAAHQEAQEKAHTQYLGFSAEQAQLLTQQEVAQQQFYQLGSQIQHIEQKIEFQKQQSNALKTNHQETNAEILALNDKIVQAQKQNQEYEALLAEKTPLFEESAKAYAQLQAQEKAQDAALRESRKNWDAQQNRWHEVVRLTDLQKLKLSQGDEALRKMHHRREGYMAQLQTLAPPTSIEDKNALLEAIRVQETQMEGLQTERQGLHNTLQQKRQAYTLCEQEWSGLQKQLHGLLGEHASLVALQKEALSGGISSDWLDKRGIVYKKLATQLKVEGPWAWACEVVLGDWLQGMSVASIEGLWQHVNECQAGALFVQEGQALTSFTPRAGTLASRLQGPVAIQRLLDTIWCAENTTQAQSLLSQVGAQESVITPEGIWCHQAWIRVNTPNQRKGDGKIERAAKIEALEAQKATLEAALAALDQQRVTIKQEIAEIETALQVHSATVQEANVKMRALEQQKLSMTLKHAEYEKEKVRLEKETQTLSEACVMEQQKLQNERHVLEKLIEEMSQQTGVREGSQAALVADEKTLEQSRGLVRTAQQKHAQLNLEVEQLRTQVRNTTQQLQWHQQQKVNLEAKYVQLENQLQDLAFPFPEMEKEVSELCSARLVVEKQVTTLKEALLQLQNQLTNVEREKMQLATALEKETELLQQHALELQSMLTKQGMIQEALEEQQTWSTAFDNLPDVSELKVWQENLAKIVDQMKALGAVNLAAIEEHKEQLEKSTQLNAQLADLTEALKILGDAIATIDEETRVRFKESYTAVNTEFKRLFPILFGGGEASLDRTDDDWLLTGLSIMARPPGKKNASIQLLSGGEKALTAVALVFAIFKLNPAPFCLLDEVDAPLDDANVRRFCALVKEMAKSVQFIYITHNKLAMEMADLLIGVSMREAGVSRLVSANMETASA